MTHSQYWSLLESEHIADCRVFTVKRNLSRNEGRQQGKTFSFYVIKPSNWINIIPITPEGNVVMVKQFRHGIREVTLEVPGGMVDSGEEPAAAAAREMLEETGYASDEIIHLGTNHPNPALQDNVCDSFVALNVRKVQEPVFDANEDIEIMQVPLAQVPEMIRKGEIMHALVITAFHMFDLHKK